MGNEIPINILDNPHHTDIISLREYFKSFKTESNL
jgi:hypothetical protein